MNKVQRKTLAFLDPFQNESGPPKIDDGKCQWSHAIRLRHTGEMTLDTANETWACIYPGFSSGLIWCPDITTPGTCLNAGPHENHYDSAANRLDIDAIRVTGVGAKFTQVNNAEENDGWWEAVRIPFDRHRDIPNDATDPATGVLDTIQAFTDRYDFSNIPTYQSGKLRDLHRYLFKLNSDNDDHDFSQNPDTSGAIFENTALVYDQSYDAILIKFHGRTDATTASRLMYDVVENFEIVYKDNTPMGRSMTRSYRWEKINKVMQATNIEAPAVQYK